MTDSKDIRHALKTMTKNGRGHGLRTTGRVLKYGIAGFARNIWLSLAATLVMTITLLVLFITVLSSVILSATADTMRSKIDITIFFQPDTSDQILNEMADTMRQDSNVESVTIANSAGEYDNFLIENASDTDLITALDDPEMHDLMVASMPATMRIKARDVDNLDSIKHIVSTDTTFVQYLNTEKPPTYDTNQSQIDTITSWANIAKNGGLILGAVFLVISILVIFNTIRMAIFSRREEIYMMKLVGADAPFIRGPFLVEASMCGVISGLLACGLGYGGFKLLAPKLSDYGIDITPISGILDSEWLIAVFAAFVLLGIIIGAFSARLAVHKYLHKA